MIRWVVFSGLALAACDDGEAQAPGPLADAEVAGEDGDVDPDARSRPFTYDLGPDGPPPDAARVGPVSLAISPGAITLVEGRGPRSVTLVLHGDITEPVNADLTTSVGVLEGTGCMDGACAGLTFEPEGPRAVTVELRAPFDDDEENDRGSLLATSAVGMAEAPVVAVDVHNTVELLLDDEQLAFVGSSRDKERRLDIGTTVNGRAGPRASANLRGKGTLNCDRRSFTVRFEEPIYIRSSPPLDHLLLLSMCLDSTLLKMRSSAELLQEEGLFPAWHSYAEVRYGGESRGVYLLVERPRKALPRVFPENTMVIRRIRDNLQEVKRPDADDIDDLDALLAPYQRLYQLRREHEGEALLGALRQHMDYDLYLRWMAINSVLQNGDYIDEVFFYDRAGPEGSVRPYFAVMAWDYDDILRRCHTPGPLPEPLFYCAESGLDRPVLDHEAVRSAYEGILREILAGPMAPDPYEALLTRLGGELEVYLGRPGVIDALALDREGEPPAAPVDAVQEMLEAVAARREALEMLLP